ncbi:hypothetical protein [Alkalihalobacterium chitinilyticum]|uniref:Uncharacterized protein n=1 Tax=Alkalihalobacterium chitinilyticum TaxID=2980103 RepID=A0ABT5VDV8_9BACI|nr:hypothetical protein [Alkalihalobacterium chitinilyticum]MDE5412663.1 hypothetical protein [Alkalihalobacterium chitinilyticum]
MSLYSTTCYVSNFHTKKKRTYKKPANKHTVPLPKSSHQPESQPISHHQPEFTHQQEFPQVSNESLDELITSVANIENALANAINAVCFSINQDNLAIEERLQLIKKLEEVINLTININIILEFLIEDVSTIDKQSNA